MRLKKKSSDAVKRTTAKLFLNALYGRMGMKEIDNTMEILELKEARLLETNK